MAASPVRTRVAVGDGLGLAAYEWGRPGDGTVVLLHGGGLSSAEWTEIAPRLAAGRHVVAFDARGCGASDPDPELRYGVATIAADLDRVLEAFGLDRVALVGHSLGAVVACYAAARNPEAVTAVVLVDGGPAEHTRPASLDDPPLSFASREDAALALAKSLPLGLPEWYLDARFETRPDGTLTWRGDMAGRVEWSRRGGEPLLPRLWPYVEAMQAPTTVLHGSESPLFPRAVAERMAQVNDGIRMVEVAGAGHFVHIDAPDAVVAAVEELVP
jgi:pimeloyl-ACP methyl ester carboxylesterase